MISSETDGCRPHRFRHLHAAEDERHCVPTTFPEILGRVARRHSSSRRTPGARGDPSPLPPTRQMSGTDGVDEASLHRSRSDHACSSWSVTRSSPGAGGSRHSERRRRGDVLSVCGGRRGSGGRGGDGAVATAVPAPAGEGALDRRRMNLVFVTILLGMLLAALDQTIVSTALPTIVGRPRRRRAPVLGGLVVPARRHHRHGARRQVRRPVRAQARLPGSAAMFVVASALCGLAQTMTWLVALARGPGLRRRRPDGHRDGADRRRHPAARARQVPGRARRGLRGHDGARPAARRPVHRPPVVAVGVLRQPARSASASSPWPRSRCRRSRAVARPVDRLPRHRLHLARRRRV